MPRAGGATLYAVAWDRRAATEELLAFPVASDGAVVDDPTVAASGRPLPVLLRDGDASPPAVVDDPAAVDRALAAGHETWVARDGHRSTVWLRRPGGAEVRVWSAAATAAAPAVAMHPDGVLVAFHHNLREDSGEVDLAKWIAVRLVRPDGAVLAPAASMTDRDRDREGEEQGFEFPSLAVGPDGAVALFGRGSHAHYRQDLSAEGFAPRRMLGEGQWGCRGRWVAACTVGDQLVTARRDKPGLLVDVDALPLGGAPRWTPTPVEPPCRSVVTPRRPDHADPAARDGRRTLFGDIHQHSAHSDGIGTADEPYLRARHVYGDDFCALTDHESFLGKRIGPGEWAYLSAVAEAHDAPGEMATLIAYEWTGRLPPGPGHKVVYLPSGGGDIVSRDDVPEGVDLVARLKATGAIAAPHHVGWTGANEEAHDPAVQPVWEVCSCHGCYVHADHPLGARGDLRDQVIEEVLRRGHRFGFIACSDGHGLLYHHGVARKRDPFRCGLTAVQAESRTRDAILAALRARRCYATSGAPILLGLRAGDVPMGGEVPGAGAVVEAEAAGVERLRSLSLIGPDGVLAAAEDGASLTLSARVGGVPWVYAKAEQADGEMAWSSPLFFRR